MLRPVQPPPSPAHPAAAPDRELVLVEQSGLHGYLDPFPDPDQVDRHVGGAAWHAAEIRKIREREGEVLLMSGGDVFSGPDLAMKLDGEPVVELMNRDGYDLWTLGNHDLDKGQEVLARRIAQARFPVLAVNLVDARTGQPIAGSDHPLGGVQAYHVKDLPGGRVAVIGLMKPDTPRVTSRQHVEGLAFEDPESTLRRILPEMLREHRPDCLVLHYQYLDQGEALAGKVREMAREMGLPAPYVVAMGGHGYPEYDRPVEGEGTLAVQSTDRGTALNCLRLRVDPASRRVAGFRHDHLPIVPDATEPDLEVLGILEGYRALLPEEDHPILGFARAALPRRRDADSPLGNLATDAVRLATRSDACVLAGGGFKAGLAPGAITAAHLREALPFDNRVATMKLTGRALRTLLEQSVDPSFGSAKVLQMSGMEIVYDPQRPFGSRILSARFFDGSALEDDRTYRVAADDFLVGGGDGYSFQEAREVELGEPVRDVVARHIRRRGLVGPVATGRIQKV